MKITYFLPCHKPDPAVLRRCVEAIRAQEGGNERRLVTVPDCDPLGADAAAALGIEVITTQHSGHRGLAASCNSALAACDTELFCKVDDDVVLAPDWERRCVGFLTQADRETVVKDATVAVGGRLLETVKGPADQWRAAFMSQGWERHHFLSGFATMFRTDALRVVGGWNEQYKQNYEDVDLSRRLTAAGFRLVHDPSILAWHQKTDTIESVLRTYWKWHRPALDERDSNQTRRSEFWRSMARAQIAHCSTEPALAHLAWISLLSFVTCVALDDGRPFRAAAEGQPDAAWEGGKAILLSLKDWPWPDDFDDQARFIIESSRKGLGGV